MGKRIDFDMADQYILWAEIPRPRNGTFNRAFGPFKSRGSAYNAKVSLIRQFKNRMLEDWYSEEEIEKKVGGIKWTTTRLWTPK